MRSLRARLASRRRLLLGGVLLLAVAAAAGAAYAAYLQDNVDVYTGCVTSGGTLTKLAVSAMTPLKPCGAGETVIHISGNPAGRAKSRNGTVRRGSAPMTRRTPTAPAST
jgi:uncharacterized protein YraI